VTFDDATVITRAPDPLTAEVDGELQVNVEDRPAALATHASLDLWPDVVPQLPGLDPAAG